MRRGEREVRLPLAVGLALCVVSVLLSTPSGLSQSAPAVDSASVDGSSLTLTFSESLTSGSTTVASEFAVKLGEESIAVTSASISGSDVTLTLMEAVPRRRLHRSKRQGQLYAEQLVADGHQWRDD